MLFRIKDLDVKLDKINNVLGTTYKRKKLLFEGGNIKVIYTKNAEFYEERRLTILFQYQGLNRGKKHYFVSASTLFQWFNIVEENEIYIDLEAGNSSNDLISRHTSVLNESARQHNLLGISYVYFIRNKDNGLYKIGVSIDPISRFHSHEVSTGCNLEFIGRMIGDRNVEQEIHQMFSSYNKIGEWFYPSEDLIQLINNNILRV